MVLSLRNAEEDTQRSRHPFYLKHWQVHGSSQEHGSRSGVRNTELHKEEYAV